MRRDGKATRINLFDLSTPPMRAFHLSWFAFFLCFFAWLDGIAHMYYHDHFGLGDRAAGFAAGSLGMMHRFARTLGGLASDRFGGRWGLKGRVNWLFAAILIEGLGLMVFSRMTTAAMAIPAMIGFGLFMKMAEGAAFAVVPFVNRKALGSVSGIVGAGGNAGAMAAGFLFRGDLAWPAVLLVLGVVVTAASFLAFAVRFSTEAETEASREFAEADAQRRLLAEAAASGALSPAAA